jgi:EmrB/QacA subfamily drug resistance transporter
MNRASTPSRVRDQARDRTKARVLPMVLGCQLMIVLDGTMMYTALPPIRAELGFSPAALSWVQNAYMLALGGCLLLGARVGDRLGHGRVFVAANAGFVAASVAAGLAPSAAWLIVARAAQGLAAAFAAPAALALLMLAFAEGAARARAIGLYTAVSGGGSALGLVAGGMLTSLVSWRATMFVNLPIGLLMLAAARGHSFATPVRAGRFDLAGAVTGTLGMSLLVFGFVQAAQRGMQAQAVALAFVMAALLLAAFIRIEARTPQPVLPLSLFASASRTCAYIVRTLLIGGMLGTFFYLTQYVQGALGFDAFEAGCAFLPLSITQFLMVLYGVPKLMPRLGARRLVIAGLILALVGMGCLMRIDAGTRFFPDLALPIFLLGLGTGAALVPLATLGVAGVGAHDAGAASGLVNVTHYVGSALGTAVIVFVVEATRATATVSAKAALTHALSTASLCAASFFVLALLIAVARRDR